VDCSLALPLPFALLLALLLLLVDWKNEGMALEGGRRRCCLVATLDEEPDAEEDVRIGPELGWRVTNASMGDASFG